jgi:hypothetical protein
MPLSKQVTLPCDSVLTCCQPVDSLSDTDSVLEEGEFETVCTKRVKRARKRARADALAQKTREQVR